MVKKSASEIVNYQQELTLAIISALELWADARYERFFGRKKTRSLDEKWFKWFVGAWGVARTIGGGNREKVRAYLDKKFRRALARDGSAKAIDNAAKHIQTRRWSAHLKKDGKSSMPLSLVSKVGFFFLPSRMVPYDTYSRKGLNVLLRTASEKGLKLGTYAEYHAAFARKFHANRNHIAREARKRWVRSLAKQLGCDRSLVDSRKFLRKVFDNLLMRIGSDRTSRLV